MVRRVRCSLCAPLRDRDRIRGPQDAVSQAAGPVVHQYDQMLVVDEAAFDLTDRHVITAQIGSVCHTIQVDIALIAGDPGADHGHTVIGTDVLCMIVADLLPDEFLHIELVITDVDLVAL